MKIRSYIILGNNESEKEKLAYNFRYIYRNTIDVIREQKVAPHQKHKSDIIHQKFNA